MRGLLPGFVGLIGLALAGQALAADLPTKKSPLAPAPALAEAFTWTGFYAGAHVGYGWGTDDTKEYLTSPFIYVGLTHPFTTSGFLVGPHVGANYQFGSIVVGAEADAEWSNISGGFVDPGAPPANPGGKGRTRLDTQFSARARLGFAFDRVLFYGTGGFAAGQIPTRYSTLGLVSESFNKFSSGYTFGGGIEYAVTDHILLRAEYRRSVFDKFRNDSVIAFPGFSGTQVPVYDTVRIGASYKF